MIGYIKLVPYLLVLTLFLTTLFYRSSLISLEKEIALLRSKQSGKSELIEKLNNESVIIYQDRIKIVKEHAYNENKTRCENALSVIRLTNL